MLDAQVDAERPQNSNLILKLDLLANGFELKFLRVLPTHLLA